MKRTTMMVASVVLAVPFVTGWGCNPCGNKKLDAGEQCDDGGVVGGDGCSATCQVEGPQHCVASTPTAFLAAARAADPGYDGFVAVVSPLALFTTTPTSAIVCDEGGAPTMYVAVLPKAAGGTDDVVIVSRKDQQPGLRTAVLAKTGAHDARYYIADGYFEGTDSTGFTGFFTLDGTPAMAPEALSLPLMAPSAPSIHMEGDGSLDVAPEPQSLYLPNGEATALVACSISPALPVYQSCSASAAAYQACLGDHGLAQALELGLSIKELIEFVRHGGLGSLAGAALYAGLAFGPMAECSFHRPPCMTASRCAMGTCWGSAAGSCLPVLGDTLQLGRCDAACETCSANPAGEPECMGLTICDIPLVATVCNGPREPLVISYCGHVKPGNHLTLASDTVSCAPGFSCAPADVTLPSSGPSPFTIDNAIYCSGGCPSGVSEFTWAGVLIEVETGEQSQAVTYETACAR